MLGIDVNYDKRIYGFDLLRAFAIFTVVHRHGLHLLDGTIFEGFPGIELPHGVDIFFVLSGFLIGYSFIVNNSKAGEDSGFKLSLNFWKRSILRILPNYYLILLVNYFLVNEGILPGSTENFHLFRFFTFTQNLFTPFYDFYWESWSLATQEWFYFLFPLLMALSVKYLKTKKAVLLISLLFILISIVYRFSISTAEYDSFWWDVTFRKVVLSRLDCIYFGVIAAWLRFYCNDIWNKYAIHAFVFGMLIFLIVSNTHKGLNTVYANVIYLSIAPIYISLWLPLLDKIKDIRSVFGKFVTQFSVLSYAIYLLNLLIIQVIGAHFSDLLLDYATLKYMAFWIITLMLSYLLYTLYENPIARNGNKWLHTSKMMYKRIGGKRN